MMTDRPLLATTTGESFQPARLHYSILDVRRLEACFRKLRCLVFDKARSRWVWHYDDEARSLKFEQSWKDVSQNGAVVLGSFYIRGGKAAELCLRSIERALLATTFFDKHIPRTVARVTNIDIANRLFSADESALTPESLFSAAEANLRQNAIEREQLLANPKKLAAEFFQQQSTGKGTQLPEFERLPTNFYEDGIQHLTHVLKLRQRLAMEHWLGNRDATMYGLIEETVTRLHESGAFESLGGSEDRPDRIHWNFGPDVPVRDFFESLDLADPFQLAEAVENFIDSMKHDEFRTWEAVMREEQDLPTTPVLSNLAGKLMNFNDPDNNDSVYYIDGIERCSQPWYEILRQIAPRLLIEKLHTAEWDNEELLNGWPRIAAWVEQRGRGLSLPEDVCRPLDVVPEELRHQLWLQSCFEPLCGLGQEDRLSLADEDERWRIDEFLELLHRYRDSVARLGVTLDNLLDRCELPDRDRPIFIRMIRDRLGLSGTDQPLAPKLEFAGSTTDQPSDPIQRLSDADIRQAILHHEPVVHGTAMWYFAGSPSRDPGLAPLVLKSMPAMEGDHDRARACICLSRLLQTSETSSKILAELAAPRSASDESKSYRQMLAWTLLAAEPSFLATNKRKIRGALPKPDRLLRENLDARISDQSLADDDRWSTFVRLVNSVESLDEPDDYYPRPEFVRRMHSLIRGLANDDRPIRWVLDVLPRTINDEDYCTKNEMIAVNLSGVLKLEAAIPYLISMLYDDDLEMAEVAVGALCRIGGDAVIEALDRRIGEAGPSFWRRAAKVLQHIHSDRSATTLQKWLQRMNDETAICRIRQALLEQFVTSEIDRARQWMIAANPNCKEARGLRRALVSISLAAGRDFPELDDWLAAVRDDLASEPASIDPWNDVDPWNEGECFVDDDDLDRDTDEWDEDEADWDEADWDDADEDDTYDRIDDPYSPFGLKTLTEAPQAERHFDPALDDGVGPIVNRGPKTGRNELCPCGSGKKYKKCCLRKQ